MKTAHKIVIDDSRNMDEISDAEVDLVVTSPPYPMIEMWDDLFSRENEDIRNALESGDGNKAFELMHLELNKTWSEIKRVVKPGGIVCVNIGDATRKINKSFQLYPNHIKVIDFFKNNGFAVLPDILWRKPANSPNKFMGSGMLPTNAYVTLEHEYILIFRKGEKTRTFNPKSERRYQSAYFWEERNRWFTDVWSDIQGAFQNLNHNKLRDRTAAFPLDLPLRLINMYSIYGDTVLDPFSGTGTTTLAAMVCARNSLAYELEEEFKEILDEKLLDIKQLSAQINNKRIKRHKEFVQECISTNKTLKYTSSNYDFPVVTKQETEIQFYSVCNLHKKDNCYIVDYEKFRVNNKMDYSVNYTLQPSLL